MKRCSRFTLMAGALALAACSAASQKQGAKLAGESTFDPAPAAGSEHSFESQVKRWKGQKEFLTPMQNGIGLPSGSGMPRAVEESDIFKIGPQGSKLLYLLNRFRGLQIVDFTAGANAPVLAGRVDATGNWANDLYSDEAHHRLIALENNTMSAARVDDDSMRQSRLVIYDVADASKPKIATTIDLKGQIAESRRVGDILYVATSVRPNFLPMGIPQTGKGYVYSFHLGASVEPIQTQELSAPLAFGSNMNVVEVKDGDAFKYYLVAVLAKDGWGFGNRQSLVEVVDISDTAGQIKPLMVVAAKGGVRERSQTSIKNGHLVVISNYIVTEAASLTSPAITRIAVESFALPTSASNVIDATESQFRKLAIDRNVSKKEKTLREAGVSGDALEDALKAYREEQLNDPEIGLKSHFVQQVADDGAAVLVKVVADSAITIGNTQGLAASVQDVRIDGDKLFVFWVPANNIDPLDVFDMSNPASLKHVGHLEFDGWIQRAIPVTYQGKSYILGLGWVIPTVDNERQRRYPQAMLFAIEPTPAGRIRSEVLAQINLGNSNVFADFNAPDKMITTRFTGEGQGSIMFAFSSLSLENFTQGGKLVGFDLTKAATDPDKVFSEGGVLSGGDGWLRRIFNNPEIERINAFSDTSLGTFDVSNGIGEAGALIAAANTLELARNVQAFDTLKVGDTLRGLQVISQGSIWDDAGATELRLVDMAKPDAEANQVLAHVKLAGAYLAQLKLADDAMLVLTRKVSRLPANAQFPMGSFRAQDSISLVKLTTAGTLAVSNTASWELVHLQRGEQLWQQQNYLTKLPDGRVLASIGTQRKVLTVGETTITAVDPTLAHCPSTSWSDVKNFDGRLYITYSEIVLDPVYRGLIHARNFLARLEAVGETLSCGAAVNVPGKVMHVFANGHIVTEDSRRTGVVEVGGAHGGSIFMVNIEPVLASLNLEANAAVLKDLYDQKGIAAKSMKVVGNELLFVESSSNNRPGWGRDQLWENRLAILGFDTDAGFTKTSYVLESAKDTGASLSETYTQGSQTMLLIAKDDGKLGLLQYDGEHPPTAKKLQRVDVNGERSEAALWVDSGAHYFRHGIHFSAAQKSFEIAAGLFGVTQLFIAE